MKQHQQHYSVSDDSSRFTANANNNAKMNRNSLPLFSSNSSSSSLNCHLCMRNLQSSPSLVMIINDHYYHRECFKCSRCDKFLAENEAHTLIEHKYLYCGNCFIKRKPLQSTSTNTNNNNNNNNTTDSTVSKNISLPATSSLTAATTASSSTATLGNNLNELKLKFESVQKNNKYLNNNKILNLNNNEILMSSTNVNHTNLSTVLASFSSSSSSSNFSLSPSSSSSWSSSNHSSTHSTSLSAQPTSQINQRISTYNNLAASSSSSNRATTENLFKKRVSNNLETPSTTKNHYEDQTVQTPTTTTLTGNLKRNDSKKTLFSSTQTSPECCFNTNNNNNIITVTDSTKSTADTHLLPYKQHSSKCNITIRKMRRGNKRSKSLPSKFNIDSLLDYLNCSMIINKYELKKLNHQRNMLLNSNNGIIIYNSKNRYRHLLTHTTANSSYKVHQFSSGYNSENHSNSSNSTTNGTNTNGSISLSNSFMTTSTHTNKNINFYRLSLSHLPLHFLHLQCTCGASNLNSSIDMSRCVNDALSSSSSLSCFNSSKQTDLKVASPNDEFDYEEDDEVESDDEDEDEDEEEEEEEEEEDLIENTSLDENLLNQTTTLDLNNENTTTNGDTSLKKPHESDIKFQFNNASLYRAPGTSHCQHTVRVDVRRVRSCRDLAQQQCVFTPDDFVFREKLGEGFFANVKKIISKKTNQEMVLKELKLSCINNNNTSLNSTVNTSTDTGNQSLNGSDLDLKSDESLVRGDFLINYAELNAAHKSFLKEAQVLRNLNHPNVIKFMGIMFTKEKHLNLILEYISGGTLKDIIHNIQNVLPWKLRVGYAKDIASAMEYLHSLNIIHRDLKSDNCLVRENGRTVVVADFGLSRINNYNNTANASTATNSDKLAKRLNDSFNLSHTIFRLNQNLVATYAHSPQSSSSTTTTTTTTTTATNSFIVAAKRKLKRHTHQRKQRYAVVGNSFSMAPEMLKHQIYDERVDIFSFGIICCEIIGRVQADPDYLPRTSDFGLNVELFRKKYCEADCPKHFIKIAIACCELEPDKRPPFTKTHLWLETILSHLESNNPIPKNLLKNILDQNTKRPLSSLIQQQQQN